MTSRIGTMARIGRGSIALMALLAVFGQGSVYGRTLKADRIAIPIHYLSVATARQTENPAVFGTTIAFAGEPWKTDGYEEMFIGDVAHWRPRRIFEAHPEPMINLIQLSAKWLAWVQYGVGFTWDIYARSRATGKTYTVATSRRDGSAPVPYDFPDLSLSGSTVAWSFVKCARSCRSLKPVLSSSVVTRALPDGKPRIVARRSGNCYDDWPSISGTVLVFQQEGICGPWGHGSDVFLTNLATRNAKRLTNNHGSSEPVTNGRFVAWKQGAKGGTRFEDGAIMLLNRSTGSVTPASLKLPGRKLPTCSPKPHRVERCEDQPIMSNGVLVWTSASGSEILARDLKTRKEYVVYIINSKHVAGPPSAVWNKNLVWEDTKAGSKQLSQEIAYATVP